MQRGQVEVNDRVLCMVRDCPRTMGVDQYQKRFGHPPGTWICQKHWQLVPKALRRVKARHERRYRRYGAHVDPKGYARLWRYIWRAIYGCG